MQNIIRRAAEFLDEWGDLSAPKNEDEEGLGEKEKGKEEEGRK